jgi:hypothetical protein
MLLCGQKIFKIELHPTGKDMELKIENLSILFAIKSCHCVF